MYMFDVSKDSPEYKEKLKGFFDTIGNTDKTITVVSLKRIQNPDKYQEHAVLLKSITKKYPELKRIDVKYLFHGCREETIGDIAVQGFNRNYAGYNGMILYYYSENDNKNVLFSMCSCFTWARGVLSL